jgi:hypothetical protein
VKKRKPSSKPRKWKIQTMAEKGQLASLYPWRELLDSYVYAPDDRVNAHLQERDGKWIMQVVIDGKRYAGERPTLEQAFKATTNLIYKHAKEFWLRMDSHAVIRNFEDFLKGEI